MEIRLPARRDSNFVTVSETFYPGWNAYAGAQRRTVSASAAGPFCGINLRDGDSTVRLVFEPATVQVGCFLALLGLGALAGMPGSQRARS